MTIEKTLSTKRLRYIDFLKFIGLTGIIIAHVAPPAWLMMARNFDVPFMVILSAILAEKSFQKHTDNQSSYIKYFFGRVRRLVIPTWIFLGMYFAIICVFTGKFFDLKYYIASFALTRYGIGYVWIILIYLYSALLIPLFSKIKLSKCGALFIILAYILYEVAYYFQIGVENKFIETTFYYIVPYGLLTYLGYNYSRIKKRQKYLIAVTAFLLFIGCGIYYWIQMGELQSTQIAKYPPRCYYLGYGIAISLLLLFIFENKNYKVFDNKIICFISKHSMWIYLWHILILNVYAYLDLPMIWYVKLPIVYIGSIFAVFIVNKVLDLIEKKKKIKFLNYFRG